MNFAVLTHKYKTYLNYLPMKKKFPKDFTYIPKTYLYPENKTKIIEKFQNYKINSENLWLIKPQTGSLGKGIYIFQNLKKTPEKFLLTKYINHPHLINGYKYDFRVYALITGVAPLKLYFYKEGMVRFASKKYSLEKNDLKDSYRHLTNIFINKQNKNYISADEVDTEEGYKWSLTAYKNYCEKNNISYKKIRKQMSDIIIKSFITVHSQFVNKIKKSNAKYSTFFQIYGFDFIVDENLKVFLLEINDRPSLLMGDINDYKLKPRLVNDALNIAGIVPFSHDYKSEFVAYDEQAKNFPKTKNKDEEIQQEVDDALCEFGRPRGNFELIFPLAKNVDYYKKFFELSLRSNYLLWKSIKEGE